MVNKSMDRGHNVNKVDRIIRFNSLTKSTIKRYSGPLLLPHGYLM